MKKISAAHISSIPATLFFPLYARAMENGRKDALFEDLHSVRFMDSIDFDFSIFQRMKGKLTFSRNDMLAGISIRTKLIDDIVAEFMEKHPAGLVVNIGCGLDSRFQRLDNGKIYWIDMDVSEVIEIRKQLVDQNERYRLSDASVLDESWIEAAKTCRDVLAPAMIMAEGTLMYFEEPEVKAFFNRAAANFPGADLCFEVMGTGRQHKVHPTVQCLGVHITCPWGIDDYAEFEKWNPKLRLLDSKSLIDYYPHRWGLLPRTFAKIFSKNKNKFAHSIIHLKIISEAHAFQE